MGYDTIQMRAFVKLDEKRVIPFVQSTDSNLYDFQDKNVKSTWVYQLNSNKFISESDIVPFLDGLVKNALESKYNDKTENEIKESLGWYSVFYTKTSRESSYKQMYNFFKNGIKESVTLEDIIRESSIYATLENKTNVFFNSTKDLIEFIDNTTDSYYLNLTNIEGARFIINENKKLKALSNPRAKKYKPKFTYYVYNTLGYYCKKNGNYVKYFKFENKATKFSSENKANEYMEFLNENFNIDGDLKVIKVTN